MIKCESKQKLNYVQLINKSPFLFTLLFDRTDFANGFFQASEKVAKTH